MARRQQQADRALRPAMRSPGRPMPARHVERACWRLIAQGKRTEEAALQIGVSTPVAVRWFRHAGGMPPLSLAEPTGRYLSFSEREEIALLKMKGQGVPAIARELKRDPGTISRELRRNAATRGGKPDYRASVAQWKAQTAARRPKPAKLASIPRLQEYVQTRLSGRLQRPDGTVVAGPPTTWKGLNKPHRADRRWATAWSPEQISRRLVLDFPDDVDMRISHEQYTSLAFSDALREAGIAGSIGSVGDALDNALMESTIGLFKTELIDRHQRSWTGRAEVERETAAWVHWYNTTRLHSAMGHVPPVEHEQHYRDPTATPTPEVA